MLTITTNKEKVYGIATGEIESLALPFSDFYEKRILKILDLPEGLSHRQIIDNLRAGMYDVPDTARHVRFTAGGFAGVVAKVTFKIGKINNEASETFICRILEVTESDVERVQGEVVEDADEDDNTGRIGGNMTKAPAVRKLSPHTAFCKYCKQARTIQAPDGLSAAEYDDQATFECDCPSAKSEKRKRMKLEAAGAWLKNYFSSNEGALQVFLCAVRATYDGAVDSVTINIGSTSHKIDRDKDDMIRIAIKRVNKAVETF